MFDGFTQSEIAIGDTVMHVTAGGSGPPLLLLHGYPQTRAAWHAVADSLARHFTLIIPDLPGYGASRGPAPETANYAKRRTAQTLRELVRVLGYEHIFVAGHDRGGRIGFRLALDYPELVRAFAPIDIVPTLDACEAMDWKRALKSYHWLFLAQPAPLAERLIGLDPDFYLDHLLTRWAGDRGALDRAAVDEYTRCFRNPTVIAATCADYRAAMSIDLEQDAADRASGKRIRCPVRVIWGRGYFPTGSPLPAWRRWAAEADEVPLDCGHFIAEEAPAACAEALVAFFGRQQIST
ncbi:MAG: haloacetate dehalogenase [Aliidongia sp.]|jgi:haloacetate dehalogenase|nr:haloacetate dehalogenase [Aliidongia sp.]